jgi:hypothetical protein
VAAIPRRRPTEAIPSPPAADPSQQRETPKPTGWGRETMRRREGATEIGVGLLGGGAAPAAIYNADSPREAALPK